MKAKKAPFEPEEVNEEQKFTAAFTAAIEEAEKKAAAAGNMPRGSRIVQVTTREEHEKQAQTMSAFVMALTREFMDQYAYLTPEFREFQRKRKAANGNYQQVTYADDASADYNSQRSSVRSSQRDYYG